jgi:LytS/YehU family sensor histidine kinase
MLYWGLQYWTWPEALLNKTVLVSLVFVLTLGLRRIYQRARAHPVSPPVVALLIAVCSCGGAALWRESHDLLFRTSLTGFYVGKPAWEWAPIPLGTFLYGSFVLLAWSLLYNGIKTWEDLQQQKERAGRAELLAREARLRALQFQLEPHFLFNTLNAISTLVVEGDGTAAARMLTRLSDSLRLTLETGDTPEVTVARELEFVSGYLEIEKARFGDRLEVSIEAGPEVMDGLVPALILQPLIENAVKHGILAQEQGGSVRVAITREANLLRLTVSDNGAAPAESQRGGRRGLGLANTAARLQELYGPASELQLTSSSGTGMCAALAIPFRTLPLAG